MTCLRCGVAQEQVAMLTLRGVPHHAEGHKTVHDWDALFYCSTCGNGELRTYSHDCWAHHEDEPWDQEYSRLIPAEDIAALRTAFAGCSRPFYPDCDCATHTSLRDTRRNLMGIYVVGDKPEQERPLAHVSVDEAGVPAFVGKRPEQT